MDQNKPTKSSGDNSNAPGTNPTQDLSLTSTQRMLQNASAGQGTDPKAPYAVDPLNSGIPTAQAVDADNEILEVELGGTGTIIVHGILADSDYNPDLSGPKRIEIYDKMRKGDATVRLGLAAVKHPILAAGWYIKPGEGEEEDGEKTQFVQDELFNNPNFSFTQFLRQALLFCDYGNSFFEKVFRMRVDGKIGWKKFASRLPKTIYRYTLQDGVTPGITQYLPTGGIIEIPQWKLLSFILDLEGSNYEGQSLMRAAYMHWHYKDLYYRIDAIASERQGMGVPIIKVPAQALQKDKDRAKVIARNLRVNEQAYVDLPQGFTLEYIDTKAKELKEVKEMVMHHDRQILKAFLAHFLDMGAQSSGTRNLSDDQSELFLVAEQYLAKIFQEPMNLAIRELVNLNWTGTKQKEYPTLEHGSIGQIDFAKMAEALSKLAEKGIVVPDPELEKYVRTTMQLPDAVDPKTLDDDDLLRRKVIQPPPIVAPDSGIGGKAKPGQSNGKLPARKPQRIVNSETAFEFAEGLLAMKDELEDIIAEKDHAY
jgi:hypothetical protein